MSSTAASGATSAVRASGGATTTTAVNAPTSVSTTRTAAPAPGEPPLAPGPPMSRATCDPELVKMLEKIEKNVAGVKQRVIRMSRATSPP